MLAGADSSDGSTGLSVQDGSLPGLAVLDQWLAMSSVECANLSGPSDLSLESVVLTMVAMLQGWSITGGGGLYQEWSVTKVPGKSCKNPYDLTLEIPRMFPLLMILLFSASLRATSQKQKKADSTFLWESSRCTVEVHMDGNCYWPSHGEYDPPQWGVGRNSQKLHRPNFSHISTFSE